MKRIGLVDVDRKGKYPNLALMKADDWLNEPITFRKALQRKTCYSKGRCPNIGASAEFHSVLVQQSQNVREHLHAAFQNTMHLSNGNAIVDNGNACADRSFNAMLHRSFCQHAASAVDD